MSAIIAIFKKAQLKDISHSQLSAKLVRIFHETDVDEFTLAFINCLKKAFKCNADLSHRVDKIIEFSVLFVLSVAGLNVPEAEATAVTHHNKNVHEPTDVNQFVYEVFDFLNRSHRTTHVLIRKRICQFVAKFFQSLREDALLDCNICDMIESVMTMRLKDKIPVIRMQAILAVFRLQDRSNKNCPITKALLESIETDSCADVRKLALSRLSISQKSHVRVIIDRICDISEKVRAEAYVVLSKVHIKQLTIDERKRLLHTGLYDTNECVRNTVKEVLLPAWLKKMDDDILNLLKALDVNFECTDVMIKMLMALFEKCSNEKLSATFRSLTDDADVNVISYSKLCSESALFWFCYVIHSSPPNMVDEKDNYKWDPTLSFDPVRAALLPDLSVFCEYIATYYNYVPPAKTSQPVDDLWDQREREFVLIRLIELCKVYDYSDELGRKKLTTLCLDLLRRVETESIKPIVELYYVLQTNLDESISKIVEIINDLLHPTGDAGMADESMLTDDAKRRSQLTELCDTNVSSSQDCSQSLKFKIAQLEVRLNELEESRHEAVSDEDYEKAGELKGQIGVVREEIKHLEKELLKGRRAPTACNMSDNDDDDDDILIGEDNLFADEIDPADITSPLQGVEIEIVIRCVLILREMFHLPTLRRLTPALRTLFQLLVLPACKCRNEIIAPPATEVLGSFCLRDKALAKEYFTTFFALYTADHGDIGLSSLKVVFDLLLCFGPETFNISNLNEYEIEETAAPLQNELDLNRISINDGSPRGKIKSNSDDSSSTVDDDEVNDKSSKTTTVTSTTISGYTFVSVLIDLLDDEWEEARIIVIHGLCKLMATGKLKSAKVLTRLLLTWFNPNSRDSIEISDCLNYFIPFFIKRCSWSLSLFENAFVSVILTLLNAPPHSPLSQADPKMVMKVLSDILSPNFLYNPDSDGQCSIHGNLAVSVCNAIIDSKNIDHQAVLLKGLLYLDLSLTDASILTTLKNLAKNMIKKFTRKRLKKLLVDAEKFKAKVVAAC